MGCTFCFFFPPTFRELSASLGGRWDGGKLMGGVFFGSIPIPFCAMSHISKFDLIFPHFKRKGYATRAEERLLCATLVFGESNKNKKITGSCIVMQP